MEESDPVNSWLDYLDLLVKRANHLIEKAYQALRFTEHGTDLKVGLPENYIRKGGKGKSKTSLTFIANLPTEEVYTLPHKDKIN